MTRILVCGVVDDAVFVHNKLHEVNKIYGPVTSVIHGNHAHALSWQQSVSRGFQPVKHLPVTEDFKDGLLAGERCRDRMFKGRPEYVIVFQTHGPGCRDKKVEKIVHRALREGLVVLTYETAPVARTPANQPANQPAKRLRLVAA